MQNILKKIRNIILSITGLFLINSLLVYCSPTFRAQKNIDKAVSKTSPDYVLGYLISKYNLSAGVRETTLVYSTIHSSDTILQVQEILKKDTVQIVKKENNATVRIVKVKDTVKVTAECQTDTVYIKQLREVTKPAQNSNSIGKWFVIGFVAAIFAIFLFRLAKVFFLG